jgi:two-component system nitrogen regulation sensor histidine kinase GlnL
MESVQTNMKPDGRRVLEHLNTAVLVFDENLRLASVNPAAEMLFGISNRQVNKLPAQQLFSGDPRLLDLLHEVLDSGHTITEREMPLTLADGAHIYVDCTLTAINEPGTPLMVMLEMIRVDRIMRITKEENLMAQGQAARSLLRGIAHEVKNPLGGLRGAAQLLEQEFKDDTLREYTRIIIGEADRLRNLVNRILGPNKVPKKQAVNIHEALERIRSLILVDTDKELQVQRDYDTSIPLVNADLEQLIQAMLNIVKNAERAIHDKGRIVLKTRVERKYTLGSKRYPLVCRIDIIDNGPGIPDEMKENIFMPMVTGFEDGTGLGLSIAQSIINQHQGLIEFESEPGKTTFTILLPIET